MKRFAPSVLILGVLTLAFLPGCKTMSSEELKNSIEVLDYGSKWVHTFYQAWPSRLKLAPQISFRVKNISAKPMNYVNFSATFVSKTDQKNLGDAFLAAIRGKAVAPGDTSKTFVLTPASRMVRSAWRKCTLGRAGSSFSAAPAAGRAGRSRRC